MEQDSVNHLQQLIADGGERAFEIVPMALENVIRERQWQGRTDKEGQPFESFERFAEYPLWWGLESTIDDLRAFCRKRPDVENLILAEMEDAPRPKAGPGRGHKTGDNITGFRGTASTPTLKRLKRDRIDLFERVLKGELSANAAAIEAGFWPKSLTVRASPEGFANAAKRHLNEDELDMLIELLTQE